MISLAFLAPLFPWFSDLSIVLSHWIIILYPLLKCTDPFGYIICCLICYLCYSSKVIILVYMPGIDLLVFGSFTLFVCSVKWI